MSDCYFGINEVVYMKFLKTTCLCVGSLLSVNFIINADFIKLRFRGYKETLIC